MATLPIFDETQKDNPIKYDGLFKTQMQYKQNSNTIYFIGDIHGATYVITQKINQYHIKNSIFIQLGDFGCGLIDREEEKLIKLNELLRENNDFLYVVRGNHDNPYYFNSEHHLNKLLSNIVFVSDYDVISITNEQNKMFNILCVGGATSICRLTRTVDHSYWLEEVFVLDEEKVKTVQDIDCVCSHSVPDFAFPQTFDPIVMRYINQDNALYFDLTQERQKFGKLHHLIKDSGLNKLKYWFYGHFHNHKQEVHEETTFRLVNCNEFVGLNYW